MDNVDGSDHYATESRGPLPSLLNVIVDTNPYAWALLKEQLSFSKAISNLEVFINAHLAFNNANSIAIIASHLQKAEFLYPQASVSSKAKEAGNDSMDVDMSNGIAAVRDYANFYKPFADLKARLDASLRSLVADTPDTVLQTTHSTSLAGAFTLALNYTNRVELGLSGNTIGSLISAALPPETGTASKQASLNARILVISVSAASASQYIPLMNTVFAAQRMRIPIDVLHIPLGSDTTSSDQGQQKDQASSFLQQAADATHGIFLPLRDPHGMLQTLLMAYLPSGPSREMLIVPTDPGVDFRAACFCHQNTVDVGYVCSVCLSIFCEPPADKTCLTCGTPLKLGGEGWAGKPAVLPKRKKKKRKREDVGIGDSGTDTTRTVPAR